MTKIIKLSSQKLEKITTLIIESLNKNQLVIIPTDTVYGFICQWNNENLETKIRDAKCRDQKPFIHLVKDLKMLKEYSATEIPEKILNILPAPITLIVESKIIQTKDNSIALRYPRDPFLLNLLNKINCPCLSTSANLSNQPMPEHTRDMIDLFKDKADLIIVKEKTNKISSTILDIRTKPYTVLRKGNAVIPNDWLI